MTGHLPVGVWPDECGTPPRRPRGLDLYAGTGGSGFGYALAGFDMTLVDDVERPDRCPSPDPELYPGAGSITWVTGDANTYPLDGFDLLAGSPPCTDHTTRRTAADRTRGRAAGTEWMLPHTIERFRRSGRPYVVENVGGARAKMDGALILCGSMFGLVDDDGWMLERHRLFVSNLPLMAPGPHRCRGRGKLGKAIGVYGDLTANDRACGGAVRPGGDMRAGVDRARRLMRMPWADAKGLALGIPPPYTQWIGEQARDVLSRGWPLP